MANIVRKRFYASAQFQVPAGVTKLRVFAEDRKIRKIGSTGDSKFHIDESGAMFGWGSNDVGQLGDGTATFRETPVAVIGGHSFRSINMEGENNKRVYAIDDDGKGYAWGENGGFMGNGTLGIGNGTAAAVSSPVAISGLPRIKRISKGVQFDGAITTDGTLWLWGFALPGGPPSPIQSTPVAVASGIKWREVFLQPGLLPGPPFGIDADGNAWVIAHDNPLVIAMNDVPYDVAELGTPGGVVAAGGAFGDGNPNAGFMNPDAITSTPTMVVGGHKFKKIVRRQYVLDFVLGFPSTHTTYGLTDDGKIVGWGLNQFGEVAGDSGARDSLSGLPAGANVYSTPVVIVGGADRKYVDLVAVPNASSVDCAMFALTDDGDIYAWGDGSQGILGTGSTDPVSTPTLVVSAVKFKKLIGGTGNAVNGFSTMFALSVEGDLYAWGSNDPELGTGALSGAVDSYSTPTLVAGGLKWLDAMDIAGSSWQSRLGVNTDGDLYEWGYHMDDEMSAFVNSVPVAVAGAVDIDTRIPQESKVIDVAPGETVPIEISGKYSAVNGEAVAKLPSIVVIEYET